MEQLLKMTNVNKYISAIKAANALRTGTYVVVATLALLKVMRVYKAIVK